MADIKEQARQDYIDGLSVKEIAEKFGKTAGTIRSWKSRYKWDVATGATNETQQSATDDATLQQRNATQRPTEIAIEELNDSNLTDKQKAFVIEYVRLSNATQAYINVYDVDYKTATGHGPRLVGNGRVQQAIKELRAAKLQELSVTAFDLVEDMAKEARADIGDFLEFGHYDVPVLDDLGEPQLDVNGDQVVNRRSWVQFKDQDKVDTSLIKKVTMGKDGPIIELHDRSKSRDQVMSWLADQEASGTGVSITIIDDLGGTDE